ncbi:hypothetical protein [Bradyrhizobium sp. Ash2021]|uniref:hypothetical protein n=1 Tax=Bradyrhizobium sp. Ash2021 TaxID=2954771 RepID=UPI0028153A07|nr:hypothetical protein [Bradyrhizobium sp. Ash2021]WMT79359.1 hypothetical protein NL528_33260 [Bradyrhizobium sp. Ash2021]
MNQQVEYLRLHRNKLAATVQLAKGGVENMIFKVKFHVRYRIFSQETIKSVSGRDQALGKVLSARLRHSAQIEVAIPLPLAESIL